MGLMKDLDGLNAAYASMRESDQPMLLTKADKTGNTPAWRNRHKTSVKTGKPLYKMADHLKDDRGVTHNNALKNKILPRRRGWLKSQGNFRSPC